MKLKKFSLWLSDFLALLKVRLVFPAGADFNSTSIMMEVPAMTETITLSSVPIVDDDINEAEEVFIVVIKLLGVAQSTACFQQQSGGECMGNTGGIIIRIRDDDRKLIPHSCLTFENIILIHKITNSSIIRAGKMNSLLLHLPSY